MQGPPAADGPKEDPGADRTVGLPHVRGPWARAPPTRVLLCLALITGSGQAVGRVAGAPGRLSVRALRQPLRTRVISVRLGVLRSVSSAPGGFQLPPSAGGRSDPVVRAGRFSVRLPHGEGGGRPGGGWVVTRLPCSMGLWEPFVSAPKRECERPVFG